MLGLDVREIMTKNSLSLTYGSGIEELEVHPANEEY